MRTAATTLRAAVVASILVGASMTVNAQGQEAPLPAHVTGTVLELSSYMGEGGEQPQDGVTASEEPGVLREAGHTFGQRVEWSDPRLPSEHWIRLNLAIYGDDPEAGVMTLETSHLLLDDEGAYDGLYAFLRGTPGVDAHGPWDVEYEGWIFEGDVPGFPEPAEVVPGEGFLMRMAPDPEAVASSPDEAPADPMAPAAFVYTTEQEGEPDWGVDHDSVDGLVSESRGVEMVDRIEATDPRASGLMTTWQNRT